jgi:uncharacterized protein YqeY
MPTLLETLQNDSKDALRAHDDVKLQAIRMILSSAKNVRIEKGAEVDDADVTAILQKAIKSRRDSVEQFRKGGREELAAKEEREIALLEAYLPKQLTEAEVKAAIETVLARIAGEAGPGALPPSKKDLGRVIREVQALHPGRVDNRILSKLVSERLS